MKKTDKNSPVPISILYKWRKAIASEQGPPATTRHVLLTISLHMSQEGDSCFPSIKTLAAETGLSERSVCTHIEVSVKEGWLIRIKRGLKGQSWKRNEYQATLPPKALKEVQHQGTEQGSTPSREGTEPLSKGTEPNDRKALKEVQSSSSVNSTKKKRAREPPSNQNGLEEDSPEGFTPDKADFDLIRKRVRGAPVG